MKENFIQWFFIWFMIIIFLFCFAKVLSLVKQSWYNNWYKDAICYSLQAYRENIFCIKDNIVIYNFK